ncbi:MAG: histidine--tRNA ligase [Candidatus Omnitrophica bacterium]|nr:histidine--tRNA ligase [Candidatus Omnitrophota bacterium]MBU4458138.1 histidine--tRNA ligase [Candidatus Omnitrophota bacterium]
MLKALRGTKDILPDEARLWQYIEASSRYIFSIYGYKEIRTPVIEEASLFIRSIGNATDIVQKEMYVFTDRGGRQIALRPEATASVVRSYIENSIGNKEGLSKLFYIGPMFRSERPQKGRQRQFHQLGVEAIGSDAPLLDAEIILLAGDLLKKLNIHNFKIKINSLGCKKDKEKILEDHRKAIKPHLKSLCDECNERYEKNVLRVFDCKNPECQKIVSKIDAANSLCKDCEGHFKSVKSALDELKVAYEVDPRIVRGLDYYTKTVFEIVQEDLGAKDAICAGGRYNNLIQDMGGKSTPATGFAFGIERLILAIKDSDVKSGPSLDAFIAIVDKDKFKQGFALLSSLRKKGIACDIDYEDKSLKAQMRKAEKLGARFVIIFGGDEFKKGKVALRDMMKREQREVELEDITKEICDYTA